MKTPGRSFVAKEIENCSEGSNVARYGPIVGKPHVTFNVGRDFFYAKSEGTKDERK